MIFSAGASARSAATLQSGVTDAVARDVIVLPYNDAAALQAVLQREGDHIAAVMLEPVCANMGLVLPEPGYLNAVKELCERYGALCVFDEVITGFRLSAGGAQALYGVRPDLTCIGKTLGGGLPIAAFGGRADVMAALAPQGAVFQGGTFAGNPLCVAAANAFLDVLAEQPALHERMAALGRRLADGVRAALNAAGLPYAVSQIGSIVDFMFAPGPAHRNFEQARQADAQAYARYYWAMLRRGVLLAPSQMEVMFLTAAHGEADIEATLAALPEALSAAQRAPL
jgi:glutamate-1-semialdehyde 2,1-aminomutase